ncbi:hypothetical protein PIB30_101709 [Stylosanthes scabra]|uniref:Uncharacterized protein n=1 Tax=Stylosanthes scabra TaxID=79078 RepID=A0ABU6VVZ7_9FABA|nr:hypothetical protein [Stylosanthes scabra]
MQTKTHLAPADFTLATADFNHCKAPPPLVVPHPPTFPPLPKLKLPLRCSPCRRSCCACRCGNYRASFALNPVPLWFNPNMSIAFRRKTTLFKRSTIHSRSASTTSSMLSSKKLLKNPLAPSFLAFALSSPITTNRS